LTNPTPIRVLVADDHLILRFGLATMINRQDDMQIVAEAANGQQVVELFAQHRPDVTLMDLRMPGLNGVEAITAIRKSSPEARIIVLTIHKGDEAVYQAIRAGARGYLLKDVPFPELLAAIRTVHEGQQCIPPEIAAKMAERIRYDDLTSREIGILKLIATGLSNKLIADRLDVTESTIKHHVAAMLTKLGAEDRTHAVTLALERNIIDLDEVQPRSGAKGPTGSDT
jgi:two-component system, NarL family, response regulator